MGPKFVTLHRQKRQEIGALIGRCVNLCVDRYNALEKPPYDEAIGAALGDLDLAIFGYTSRRALVNTLLEIGEKTDTPELAAYRQSIGTHMAADLWRIIVTVHAVLEQLDDPLEFARNGLAATESGIMKARANVAQEGTA